LQREGLVSIEPIDIDDNGRKIVYYRSNMKLVGLNLDKESILLQLEQNDSLLDTSFEFPLQLWHNE
jgi:hypothetical protein